MSQRRSQDSLLLVFRSSFGETGNEVGVVFAKSVIPTGGDKFYESELGYRAYGQCGPEGVTELI